MSGILRLESLTKGNTLKQGDKTPLKYRLFDADGEKLNIAGKSAKVRLVYPDFLTIGYEKDGLTVAQDDTVTFTIDNVIPSRIYHVEIIVDEKFIFPSRADESKFTVDKSSLGTETNIIEIVGKDVLINAVKSQVDTELQPLVTSLESAQQAEIQRASAESSRVSAEAQREIDHANRSAELAGKADKVVIKNLLVNGNFSNGTTDWGGQDTTISATDNTLTGTGLGNIPFVRIFSGDNNRKLLGVTGNKVYGRALMRISDDVNTGIDMRIQNATVSYIRVSSQGNPRKGVWEEVSNVVSLPSNADGIQLGVAFHAYYANGSEQLNKTLDVRYSMLIDLTATFGAGNEPTKEEMDELIEITGYIDNEYALNNKEMLIWTLALIRRNKNAIITLGGA